MKKFKLQRDDAKLELLRDIGSRDAAISVAAQEVFASLVGPVGDTVLDQSSNSSLVYETYNYDFDTMPSIPLDTFDGNGEGLYDVWSQSAPGGLATNQVWGADDYKFTTFRLDSAVSMLQRYARDSRLDVVGKALNRLIQEIVVKREYAAWNPIMSALANATDADGNTHLIDATTIDLFQIDDVNRLLTKAKRLRTSFVDGTPTGNRYAGVTDLVVSPEIMEQVRSFVYQPLNTRGVPDSTESTALGLPEKLRMNIWENGGLPEIFGLTLIELLEMGVGKPYSVLFDSYYSGSPAFDSSADELVLGIDRSAEAFVRATANNPETNSTLTVLPDDQFVRRSEKIGWYAFIEEGYAVLDDRATVGIIV